MAVMLFVPAWTLHFWEVWAFWLLFSVLSTAVTFYFLKHDPGLVESRLKVGPTAEQGKKPENHSDADGHSLVRSHYRSRNRTTFHSCRIPVALVLSGNALVALGYYIHSLSRAAGEQLSCRHYRSAAGPECHFHRSLRHRSPSNVFGRSI
jgi:hypothetical protein